MSNSSLIVLSPSADTEGYFFYMLDGFSAVVKGVDMEALLQNPLLTWGRWTREDDGVSLSSYCYSVYCGIHLKLYDSGLLKINGSIHRFYNQGGPNNTIFTFSHLSYAIRELCNLIGIQPAQVVLHKFEIGLNIPTGSILAENIVNSALLYKNKKFKPFPEDDGMRADFTDYSVKLYAKSSGLVRYEIASKRIRYFSSFKIKTLADFFDRNKYASLYEFIITSFKKVVFFDKNTASFLAEDTRWKYSSPDFWLNLKPYQRKVEFSNYLSSLKKACITYFGELFLCSIIDIGPSIIEDSKEDFIFSALGLHWKNENNLTHEFETFYFYISFIGTRGNGQAAVTVMEYVLPAICEGVSRIRSPPIWSSVIIGRVPVDFVVFLGLLYVVSDAFF